VRIKHGIKRRSPLAWCGWFENTTHVVSAADFQSERLQYPEVADKWIRDLNAVYRQSRPYPPPQGPKQRRIAYMPRKRPDDAASVLALLKLRGALDGWDVVAIEGRSEVETADLLRTAKLFLSLSSQEGFGLSPSRPSPAVASWSVFPSPFCNSR
jgi:hypothetical protein